MLLTIFSVDECNNADNAMICVDDLETAVTSEQSANDTSRGTLFSDTAIIQKATPTVFLIVLLTHSDNAETEFTNDQFASGNRCNCVCFQVMQ